MLATSAKYDIAAFNAVTLFQPQPELSAATSGRGAQEDTPPATLAAATRVLSSAIYADATLISGIFEFLSFTFMSTAGSLYAAI